MSCVVKILYTEAVYQRLFEMKQKQDKQHDVGENVLPHTFTSHFHNYQIVFLKNLQASQNVNRFFCQILAKSLETLDTYVLKQENSFEPYCVPTVSSLSKIRSVMLCKKLRFRF